MLFHYKALPPATRGSRQLLYLAGLFNLAAALTLATLARLAPGLLGVDALSASQLIFVDLFAVMVLGFGGGYALAAYDLPRFWPFVAMGALAKAGVVVIVYGYFFAGHTAALTALMASGDALFAVLFVRLLRAHSQHHTR